MYHTNCLLLYDFVCNSLGVLGITHHTSTSKNKNKTKSQIAIRLHCYLYSCLDTSFSEL